MYFGLFLYYRGLGIIGDQLCLFIFFINGSLAGEHITVRSFCQYLFLLYYRMRDMMEINLIFFSNGHMVDFLMVKWWIIHHIINRERPSGLSLYNLFSFLYLIQPYKRSPIINRADI